MSQEEEQEAAKRYVEASMMLVDLYGQIQRAATSLDDERLLQLSDTAFKLIDETTMKAFILQKTSGGGSVGSVRTGMASQLENNLSQLMERQARG